MDAQSSRLAALAVIIAAAVALASAGALALEIGVIDLIGVEGAPSAP